jgi:PAS domain S-box-containing protein
MSEHEKVNILLVDDQPSKLLSYEVILHSLGENLLKASSGREALEHLLKSEIAVVLVDVCMPDLDGFQLAAMIREHPRFQKTAMIFISAIQISDMDRMRGYEMGAVDYVPVPVIPEVLRAKVKIFAELYRKTRQLEQMNTELEQRVVARTAELEASTAQLRESEQRRSVALAAGQMGSWDWNVVTGECLWDAGQYRIFGVDPEHFTPTFVHVRPFIHQDDLARIESLIAEAQDKDTFQTEVRIVRPKGETRWCICAAAMTKDSDGRIVRVSGVSIDITDRKEAEERQALLAREVDHRAKNALALVQSIVRLTKGSTIAAYTSAVEGRIRALSRAHTILSQSRWQGADIRGLVDEELAPYRTSEASRIVATGPNVSLQPAAAQSLALAIHELVTNAAKYGALSSNAGRIHLTWELKPDLLVLRWIEKGGPPTQAPSSPGFGTRIITASVKGQLGGEASFEWDVEGLQCVLTIPRSDIIATNGIGSTRSSQDVAETSNEFRVSGNRIMVVEDEALVAMALGELLNEMGYSVIGPFSRISEAIITLRSGRIDAAVLDINLGGEVVYPLADILMADGVPFIFVTGYSDEEIEHRFSNVPVLQKPIERDALIAILGRRPIVVGSHEATAAQRSMAS